MIGLGLRQFSADPARSALTVIGVGAVLAVVLLLQGFREGLAQQLRDVSTRRGADLIAMQAGVRNMVGARSVIPQSTRAEVEAVDGVTAAYPMTTLPIIYRHQGRRTPVFLMVVDSAGSPDRVRQGSARLSEGEVLIDLALARMHGLEPGDDLEVAGFAFRIAGVLPPTAALWTPIAFTDYDSLIEFYFQADLADDLSAFPLVSYLLIRVLPGADPNEVRQRIDDAVPEIDVHTPESVAAADEELGTTMLGAVLDVLILSAYLTGLVVVALFMFAAGEGRRRDLGVLSAMGFASPSVLMSVVTEAGVILLAAVPLGVVLAWMTAKGIAAAAPLYLVLPLEPIPLLTATAACVLFAGLGAIGPWHTIRGLDPAEVFRP